ncbi:uncharacterized protein SPSK_04671 [Sporothrix schenckii 1099-18]|uniref:Uncharacterized protein n=1 Tax=Sporothrix schenckii 1099-18 TaxID=1397361 RepID=A0A0F2M275_SPOSC|nr:uncharacterized protein SPSK_04671 [Sporothrix schenckii 1099-18]KJR82860.1 hypothetical protein SPSK_04671 [Sporothrix schenckii 1099-18]
MNKDAHPRSKYYDARAGATHAVNSVGKRTFSEDEVLRRWIVMRLPLPRLEKERRDGEIAIATIAAINKKERVGAEGQNGGTKRQEDQPAITNDKIKDQTEGVSNR